VSTESESERYMRWVETEWERRVSDSGEERRTASLLETFRDLGEESRRLVEPPEYEPGRRGGGGEGVHDARP
jgi:hypothetical protein